MEHTIDATGKKLGRVASEATTLLMGKNSPDFKRNVVADVKVTITNASKLDIDPRKRESKEYKRYSGYPGGLKHRKMEDEIKLKGYGEVVKKAVRGMLPGNKLRPLMMKNLIITE